MNNQEFRGVQALRGIAALSVVLFHFRWNINAVNPGLGDTLFRWGGTGVDLFFLISGFVITLSASRVPNGLNGVISFIKRRALRILPAYYIILLITFFLSGAMSTFHYTDRTENLISALLFMPIYPTHGPFYVDDSGMYGIRWTLNYELLFYVFISASLLFSKRWFFAASLFFTSLMFIPLVLGYDVTLNSGGYAFNSAWLGLITNPMIWLFIIGMLIGLALPYLQHISAKFMTIMFFISLILAISLFSQGKFIGHGVLKSGWIYALILFTIVMAEKVIGKYVPKFLIALGNISFSLYLIHTLMNNGIGKRFEALGIEDGYFRMLISILMSLILAWLSWRFIEKPLSLSRRKKAVRIELCN